MAAVWGLATGMVGVAAQERAELVIAQRAAATSVDPHAENFGPNLMLAAHVFDRLIHQGPKQRLVPGLATAWRLVDATTWEFALRPGVTFHDGSPFTAEDVIASWRRAVRMTGHSSISFLARVIAGMEATGPLTLRVTTREPTPLLPNTVNQIVIIPRHLEYAASADFESGAAMIGTGAFRFVGWDKGKSVRLAGNPTWWGGTVAWKTVELRAIPDDAERIAALHDRRVDVIDTVPPADVARLEAGGVVRVARTPTSRIIYLGFDVGPGVPPGTAASDGSALAANPFRDLRVRQAVARAVNRAAIVRDSMEGQAMEAAQVVLPGLFGAAPDLPPAPFDPDGARALLAQAGYPGGFRTTLNCTRQRYVNDEQVCNAIALMLTGVGIQTDVRTFPAGEFFDRAAKGEFALRLAGWGTGTGEASYTLRGLLGTRDAKVGTGVSNYGHYSNPALDAQVEAAVATFDDGDREARLAAASRVAAADLGVVPLHFQMALWATRADLLYTPTNDEFTLAILVKRAPAAN
ncbi:ABC transporter substrate-binding protein [Novispirillum sp. DQ9]|uniref:ABC transporter substrate-binding protein n=1 Tax=Novispirillum sp. DQ9 TaxID=3398612 RepID=UPI003C7C633D